MQKPNVQYKLPDKFVQKIIKLRGEQGRLWIEGLPKLLNTCAKKWQLKVDLPFSYFMYNYVTPVELSDRTKAVPKICFPSDKEFITEYEALKIFDGQGAENSHP